MAVKFTKSGKIDRRTKEGKAMSNGCLVMLAFLFMAGGGVLWGLIDLVNFIN